MQKVQVILTHEEREALIKLLDISVKAAGLNVAQAAFLLAVKLKDAPPFDDTPKSVNNPP